MNRKRKGFCLRPVTKGAWYAEQTVRWQRLEAMGWTFSEPEPRLMHLIGMEMKRRNSSYLVYVDKLQDFKTIHTTLLEAFEAMAKAVGAR